MFKVQPELGKLVVYKLGVLGKLTGDYALVGYMIQIRLNMLSMQISLGKRSGANRWSLVSEFRQ
jgi:hypothetical protein